MEREGFCLAWPCWTGHPGAAGKGYKLIKLGKFPPKLLSLMGVGVGGGVSIPGFLALALKSVNAWGTCPNCWGL